MQSLNSAIARISLLCLMCFVRVRAVLVYLCISFSACVS